MKMGGNMRYGSVCSGIEAASAAWHRLGWQPAWFAEIEAFPSAVLAHHYPDVPNLGDFTQIAGAIEAGALEAPDVLVGGTPCQAFSVAGLRMSLADARGNLTLAFVELANAIDDFRRHRGQPAGIVVWENVPGVLNTSDNAFGCFIGGMAGCDTPLSAPPRWGWTDAGVVLGPRRAVAWRVLDAQYFGLAQRRRRVFVVASARDGFDPAAVLLEWGGVRRDFAPSREAREGTAAGFARSVALRGREGGGTIELGDDIGGCLRASGGGGDKPHVITMAHGQGGAEIGFDRGKTLTCNHEAPIAFLPETAHTLRAEGFDASEDGTGRGTPLVPVAVRDVAGTITSNYGKQVDSSDTALGPNVVMQPVAFSCKDHGADAGDLSPTLRAMGHGETHANAGGQVAVAFMADDYKDGTFEACETARPLTTSADRTRAAPIVAQAMQVRRLTPRECERLQGFPDDYTAIPWRGKPASECPDGPRYKALGNSMAVPVMRWIGARIARQVAP